MTEAKQPKQQKRNASDRIQSLEAAFVSLFQDFTKLEQDLKMVNAGVLMLNEKLSALQSATNTSNEALNTIIENAREASLKKQVDDSIAQGFLVAADEVGPESLVVGRVLSENSEVVNRRFQHYANTFEADLKDAILGAKAGQVINRESNKTKVEIQEVYNLNMEAIEAANKAAAETQAPQA